MEELDFSHCLLTLTGEIAVQEVHELPLILRNFMG